MKRALTVAMSIITSLALFTPAEASSAERDNKQSSGAASFEGREIALGDGWGESDRLPEVGACHVDDDGVTCYRTEREMDAAVAKSTITSSARASCSSSLRLYDGTYKSGAVLYLTTRGSYLSLSTYGFNNRTSSYRVGACSARLYNGFASNQYPGNTSAWASTNVMWSGWSNTISSVFIN